MLMRDLSYLQAFSPKILREARRVIAKGFTVEDINEFLAGEAEPVIATKRTKMLRRLPRGARRQILQATKFGRKRP